ncbi:MAG: ABC transporter ATP-binding protein [Candidatus Bathyarchaeia archaeon]
MPRVRLINLSKRFGKIIATDKVNLTVNDGEYLTILGPSGCGKTTTLKMIAGLVEPDEGEIFIGDRLVNEVPPEDREIGYVFQDYALFPHMTVWENVTYGPYVKGWEADQIRRIGDEVLRLVGLRHRDRSYPRELSGGMIQRIALARALAAGAKLLLLDEPLSALDARLAFTLRYELTRFARDLKLTAIHVTHDQSEAMAISDRIAVMRKGTILQVGTPIELYMRPKRLFVANFIGEANFLEGTVLDVDESGSLIELSGDLQVRSIKRMKSGKRTVAVFRPETASVKKGTKIAVNSLPGTIERSIFEGEEIRYEIRLKNEDKVVVIRPSMVGRWFRVGDRVTVKIKPENVLAYPHPKRGLAEELALE